MDSVIRCDGYRFVGVVDSVWLRLVRVGPPTHQHSICVHLEEREKEVSKLKCVRFLLFMEISCTSNFQLLLEQLTAMF